MWFGLGLDGQDRWKSVETESFNEYSHHITEHARTATHQTSRSVVKPFTVSHANSPSHSLGSQESMPILMQIIFLAYPIGT